ncbi:MAG: zinc-ribbon domain-containing protein [Clostridia bacterium]|nr:zinc-ribbon domain-containing protein [Clostridia bacterium]
MAFCTQCGTQVEAGAKFCIACGAKIEGGSAPQAPVQGQNNEQKKTEGGFEKYLAYTDTTASYKPEDIDANKIVAILSYLHILVIVPLVGMKESPFAQYHAKLGLNLLLWHLIVEFGGSILTNVVGWIPVVGWLVWAAVVLLNLALWAINIFGIVSAATGKARELTFFESFKIVK